MTSGCHGLLCPHQSSFLYGDSSEVVRLTEVKLCSCFAEKLHLANIRQRHRRTKNRILLCTSNSSPFQLENVRFRGGLHFRYHAEGKFRERRRVQASALEESEWPPSSMPRITHASEDEISKVQNWNRGRAIEPRSSWLLNNEETRLSSSHLPRNRQSRLQNKLPVFRTIVEPERSLLQSDNQFETLIVSENNAHGGKEDNTILEYLQSVEPFTDEENKGNTGKSPVFSSKLEEIIHKFKKKYGSENNRNVGDKSFSKTGKDYSTKAFLAPGNATNSFPRTHVMMDVNNKSKSMGFRDKNANANDGRLKLLNNSEGSMLFKNSDERQEQSFQVRKSSEISREGRTDEHDDVSRQSTKHYGRLPPMHLEACRSQSKKKIGNMNSLPGPRINKKQTWTEKFDNNQYGFSEPDGAVIQDTVRASYLGNNVVDTKSYVLTENDDSIDSVSSHDNQSCYSSSPDASEVVSNGTSDNVQSSKVASWHKHDIPDLPFDFQYSYSETPNAPIVRYRETPFSPFGPPSMNRPWTGRAPLKPSKKKLPEFNSFDPPPKGKKGIKFVEDPGPYPEGEGPKSSKSREEIMGEPLTAEEIAELVLQCQLENRQLNLGRDGLTHNMLDLIHCHWKRRRVCKIRCIGLPTVDIENLCFHIEDKSGGKIIYRTGGVVYLFRGRNYNYKDRPKIPLMLWKPATPVYPKLIQAAPGGLSEEEADKLRDLGAKVEPLCKLIKNGVYLTLVEDVKAAFMVDDLVCIDCGELNPSDYKKIGAKLRDLVPCVLLSFDNERILMWKGKPNGSSDSSNESLYHKIIDSNANTTQQDEISASEEDEDMKTNTSIDTTLTETEDDNASTIYEETAMLLQDGAGSHPGKEYQCTYLELHSPTKKPADITKEESIREDYSNATFRRVNSLWDKALAAGMAVQLDECDISSDFVAKKAKEVAESAPIGPKYSEWLIRQLRLNREERKTPDPIETNLGRLTTSIKRKKTRKLFQRADVPQSTGLPLEDLTRFLSTK